MASTSSFSVAPCRLSRSAACPRSATSASSRCSMEAYLSLNVRVKSTARWMTREQSCEKNCSPAPSTRGRAATACCTSSRNARTLTPARPSRKAASESSSRTSTLNRCSGSTACCPCSFASKSDAWSASWAFTVSVLMFICRIVSVSFPSVASAKPLPRRKLGQAGGFWQAAPVSSCQKGAHSATEWHFY